MILNLFRRPSSHAISARLYDEIVAASRRPSFYIPPCAVPDTLDGRFEMLALHAFLVLRRLSALPHPGPDLAQDLADHTFHEFDRALREMGVGDLTVPKRMKKLAGDFGGRSAAYARALDGAEPLAAVLARNVYGRDDVGRGELLADWLRTASAYVSGLPFEAFERGTLQFPDLPNVGTKA